MVMACAAGTCASRHQAHVLDLPVRKVAPGSSAARSSSARSSAAKRYRGVKLAAASQGHCETEAAASQCRGETVERDATAAMQPRMAG